MGAKTEIAWTNSTWNPIRGCSLVSAGCQNCYAMKQAHRFSGPGKPYAGLTELGPQGPRWNGKIRLVPEALEQPLHWKKPRRVFVNSMSDLWHQDVPLEFLLAVWSVMEATPHLEYQILTKRPERMLSVLQSSIGAEAQSIMQPAYERRAIPGYQGYYADTEGSIWSTRRGQMKRLAPCIETKWGHSHVALHAGVGIPARQEKVGRIVLMTFGRMPEPGEEACHRTGNPQDNRIGNLRWGTKADNSADRTAQGNAVTRRSLSVTDIAKLRIAALIGKSDRALAQQFDISHTQVARVIHGESWPFRVLPNVWLGVSVEDQQTADERIPILLQTPAVVRWISAEPLLEPVTLHEWDGTLQRNYFTDKTGPGVDWVVVGGESGPCARPCDLAWIRSIKNQCHAANCAVFVKQLGAKPRGIYNWWPCKPKLRDKKGGDMTEWPTDLRVREWPRNQTK